MSDPVPVLPPLPIPPAPAGQGGVSGSLTSIDFGGHRDTPLAAVRWPIGLLAALVVASVLCALGGSWVAARSGILTGLSADAGAVALAGIILLQYLPPIAFIALVARTRGVRVPELLALRRFDVGAGIALAVGLAIGARMVAFQYAVLLQRLGITAPPTTDITGLFPVSPIGVIATVLTAVVFAPFAEEMIFRGVVFSGLRDRWGLAAGAIVSAAIFALIHFSWYQFFPIFVLGLGLAWLTSTTRSIWPSIVCHAVFNGTAVALLYLIRAIGAGA